MKTLGFSGWKIARIHGVDLKVHFSLIFLLLYVLMIASVQVPLVLRESGIDPSEIDGSPWVWGSVFALGLFISIVIHEFAHVLVAQSMGVRVRGITLMMLGGVSEMDRIPESRFAEFKISIVGPLSSFAISGILFLLKEKTSLPEVAFASYWLARVNLVLGIFNLLPAFPLDGGRALRSLLAASRGMLRATQTSVRIAQVFAWALGFWGFLSFNFLLMLIAVFVYTAATSELVLSMSREILRHVTARDALIRINPVSESQNLRDVAEKMMQTRHRILPVKTNSNQPAIIRVEELRRIPAESWINFQVKDVMATVSRSLSPNDSLEESLAELATAGALPVAENGKILGLVRHAELTDLLDLKTLSKPTSANRNRAA